MIATNLRALLRCAATMLLITGCAPLEDEGEPEAHEELSLATSELVWSETRRPRYTTASGTLDFGNGISHAFEADGTMTARSASPNIGETAAEGWIEQQLFLPAFLRSVSFRANVRITAGFIQVLGDPISVGWGDAGSEARLAVRKADGTVLCEQSLSLHRVEYLGGGGTESGLRPLECTSLGPFSGNVTVRVTLRTYTSAFLDRHSTASVEGVLESLRMTPDSGVPTVGDVHTTDLRTNISRKVHDTFCFVPSRCDVGRRVRVTGVGSFDGLLSFLGGPAVTATTNFVIVDHPVAAGADVCRATEQCNVAQLTADTAADVLALDAATGRFARSDNRGDGTFGVRVPFTISVNTLDLVVGIRRRPMCAGRPCLVADFTGDGAADIAEVGTANNMPLLAVNGGSGVFPASISGTTAFVIDAICSVERCIAGDVDGDGDADLIELAADGSTRIALSTGDGGFGGVAAGPADFCPGATDCQAADTNGDRRADLIALSHDSLGRLRIARSLGSGAFAAPTATLSECIGTRVCRAFDSVIVAFGR